MKIEQTYIIKKLTSGILPARQIDYDSIVIEGEKTLYIRQTPLDIIKQSCIDNWSSYEGRKEAVIHHTGFKQKLPIPVNKQIPIVAFPTHALKHINCAWLMYDHVVNYVPAKSDPTKKTTITFLNGKSITIDVSIRSFTSQMTRSLEVIQRIKADFKWTR